MYLSATVKVPEIPGKITRRKMGTNVYVLFEVGRVYDPKRQFNVPQRVTIGKLVSEAAREHESGTVFLAKWNDRRSSWNGLWPTNSRKTERLSRQSGTILSQTGTLP